MIHTYLDITNRHQIEFLNIRKLYLEKVKQKLTVSSFITSVPIYIRKYIFPNIYMAKKSSEKNRTFSIKSYFLWTLFLLKVSDKILLTKNSVLAAYVFGS